MLVIGDWYGVKCEVFLESCKYVQTVLYYYKILIIYMTNKQFKEKEKLFLSVYSY